MLKIRIGNNKDGRTAGVTKHEALKVTSIFPDLPEVGTPNRYRFFSSYLGSEGADSGIINMNVDGSATPQKFYIKSHEDYDINIMKIVITIADTSVVHNKFGNIGSLSTGWDLISHESGYDTYIIQKAKTGGAVVEQSAFYNPYGAKADAFELANWNNSGDDVQTCVFPMYQFVPGGLRIGRGTRDMIESVVNDDLTGLTEFYVRCLGYKHYE